MKKLIYYLSLFLVPAMACAAGTYYTGGYTSPQTRYGYNPSGYQTQTGYRPTGNVNNYAATRPGYMPVQNQQAAPQAQAAAKSDRGFYIDAGISHQIASWQLEMNTAGSELHYNNIGWNVFDASAGYKFDIGSVAAQVDAGFSYGMQSGESTMIDDDITNGGFLITEWYTVSNELIDAQFGQALSVGTSSGGNTMGFNIGFGLTDFFKLGRVKITPSVGYRYFSHKLETKNNHGLSVDTLAHGCITTPEGENQCDPVIVFFTTDDSRCLAFSLSPTR